MSDVKNEPQISDLDEPCIIVGNESTILEFSSIDGVDREKKKIMHRV